MDSNNHLKNIRLGERESRFASDLVASRYFSVGALEPKALGTSLMYEITNCFVLDLLQELGSPSTKSCVVVPVTIGMGMVLCLNKFGLKRRDAQHVIWSRIDHESYCKCIVTAGFQPIVVDCIAHGDQLITNVEAIKKTIRDMGAHTIVAIITTTTCFAPRAPDNIEEVGKVCLEFNIPHLVNNAYGIQCPYYLKLMETASQRRVDAYVSCTDKNFMVPVGGCVIAGYDKDLIADIGRMYIGSVSSASSLDVFITLLELGKKGYKALLTKRDSVWRHLKERMTNVAQALGEKILLSSGNVLSFGLTLNTFENLQVEVISELHDLDSDAVSDIRVIFPGRSLRIYAKDFTNWGMHCSDSVEKYLTVSATIGLTKKDAEMFVCRLSRRLVQLKIQAGMSPSVFRNVPDEFDGVNLEDEENIPPNMAAGFQNFPQDIPEDFPVFPGDDLPDFPEGAFMAAGDMQDGFQPEGLPPTEGDPLDPALNLGVPFDFPIPMNVVAPNDPNLNLEAPYDPDARVIEAIFEADLNDEFADEHGSSEEDSDVQASSGDSDSGEGPSEAHSEYNANLDDFIEYDEFYIHADFEAASGESSSEADSGEGSIAAHSSEGSSLENSDENNANNFNEDAQENN